MAIGILFIFKTPGYHEDLMSYLFGNILQYENKILFWQAQVVASFQRCFNPLVEDTGNFFSCP